MKKSHGQDTIPDMSESNNMASHKGGKKHTGKKHTGHTHGHEMVMHHGGAGLGGKDPHAHPSHHEHNKKFGMPEGMSPKHEYGEDMDQSSEGEAEMGGCCDGE